VIPFPCDDFAMATLLALGEVEEVARVEAPVLEGVLDASPT